MLPLPPCFECTYRNRSALSVNDQAQALLQQQRKLSRHWPCREDTTGHDKWADNIEALVDGGAALLYNEKKQYPDPGDDADFSVRVCKRLAGSGKKSPPHFACYCSVLMPRAIPFVLL